MKTRTINFLHIGKAAGTQVAFIIKAVNEREPGIKIVHHGHDVFLKHLPKQEEYFFSIRDPISRFVSAFYSRKRKGQPRIYSEWTAHEEKAFKDFAHANELAEALFCGAELGKKAFAAIRSIRHTSMNQVDWFYNCGNMFAVQPPFAIIRREKFDIDIYDFQKTLGVAEIIQPTTDPIISHKSDYSGVPDLSQKAVRNLRKWYRQDVEFYARCVEWIERKSR